jgi:signal transduction histidine kinase/CheY-like chemotaxis protein
MDLLNQKSKITFLTILFSAILVLVIGIGLTSWKVRQTNISIREDILANAQEVALAINPQLAKGLDFEISDSGTPEYKRICTQMIAYGKLIRQRGIYSMALRNGKIVFGPETYLPGDPLSSPAGTVYLQPTKDDYEMFKTGKPTVMGPNKDEYGTFLSGLAPVQDPLSGKVIMFVGIDVPLAELEKSIREAMILPVASTAAMLLIIGTGYFFISRRNRLSPEIGLRYRYLESYLVAIVGIFLCVLFSLISREYEQKVRKDLFRLRSFSFTTAIRNEFAKMEEDLSLLGNYFMSSQYVDSREFKSFTSPLILRSSAVNYFWAPMVEENERQSFESSVFSESKMRINIHACDRDGYSHPVKPYEIYYPLQYIQPPLLNRFLPGYDLYSDPEYRRIISIAGHNSLVMSADPERKMIRGQMQSVLLAICPVFKKPELIGTGHTGIFHQDAGCLGALIWIKPLIDNSLYSSKQRIPEMDFDLADLMNEKGPVLIGSTSDGLSQKNIVVTDAAYLSQYPLYTATPIFVFGRALALVIHPNEQYLIKHPSGIWLFVGAAILFLTGLLVYFVRFQQINQIMLAGKIEERTNELKTAKDKAEESDRLKSVLLLNMSHELRTPLNGIMGFGEILTEQLGEPEQKKMANTIVLLGKRLLVTFNSMLKLSQLEAENRKPEPEICDLGELLSQAIQGFKLKASLKRISIKESIESGVLMKIDKAMFNDILFFLVDNAIKFTEAGYVWLILSQDVVNGDRRIEIKIKDSGIGIREDQLEIIFNAFRQGSEGIGRSHEGPGLGLTICKKYIELLGGELNVESVPGTGTVFTIVFTSTGNFSPEEKSNRSEKQDQLVYKPEQAPVQAKAIRVLVVEDNQANAELVVQYLGKRFYADVASTGKLAMKYAYQNDYDLILMDINLGADMDGIKATNEIRAMKNFGTVPIIAVTGYSTAEEKEHILSHGLTDFLSKPFTRDDLFKVISKWVRIS